MRIHRTISGLILPIGLAMVTAQCSGGSTEGTFRTVTLNTVDQPDARRAQASAAAVRSLTPAFIVSAPDPDGWTKRMIGSVGLVAEGWPHCYLVIADETDRALHWFHIFPPQYHKSLYLGGRDESYVGRISSFALAPDGTLAIGDAARGNVLLMSREGTPIELLSLVRGDTSVVAAGERMVIGPGRLVIDQPEWEPTNSPPTGGTLRLWARGAADPELFAPLVTSAQETFAFALNAGYLQLWQDTVWHARAADGRLLGFPLDNLQTHSPRVIELPLYYQMERPTASAYPGAPDPESAERVTVHMQSHIRGFAVDSESGGFVVVQAGPQRQPLLVTVSRDGDVQEALDIGASRIFALGTAEDWLYVAFQPLEFAAGTQIGVYPNPFSGGSVAPFC